MPQPLHLTVTEDYWDSPGRCLHCNQPLGSDHLLECVRVTKVVRLDVTFSIEVERPYSWDNEMIESAANESSSCASNLLDEVNKFQSRIKEAGSCMCEYTVARVSPTQPVDIDITPKETLCLNGI